MKEKNGSRLETVKNGNKIETNFFRKIKTNSPKTRTIIWIIVKTKQKWNGYLKKRLLKQKRKSIFSRNGNKNKNGNVDVYKRMRKQAPYQ